MVICPGCCFFAISAILRVPFGNVFDDFCCRSMFSWAICFQKSGKSMNVPSQFTKGTKSSNWITENLFWICKSYSLWQSLEWSTTTALPRNNLAALRTSLKMPEPLTTLGLKLQPIKLFTVKWTNLTFIPKHFTKFNDCAYEKNSKASPCQQPAWCSLGTASLAVVFPFFKVIVIPLNQPVEEQKYIFIVLEKKKV